MAAPTAAFEWLTSIGLKKELAEHVIHMTGAEVVADLLILRKEDWNEVHLPLSPKRRLLDALGKLAAARSTEGRTESKEETLCDNDGVDQAHVWCAECDQSLCEVCDVTLHRHPMKRNHARHNLVNWTEKVRQIEALEEDLEDIQRLLASPSIKPVIIVPLRRNSGESGASGEACLQRSAPNLGIFTSETDPLQALVESGRYVVRRHSEPNVDLFPSIASPMAPVQELSDDDSFVSDGEECEPHPALERLHLRFEALISRLNDECEQFAHNLGGNDAAEIFKLRTDLREGLHRALDHGMRLPQRLEVVKAQLHFAHENRNSSTSDDGGAVDPPGAGSPITFMFTDVKASTELWQKDPTTMTRSLQLHHSVIRSVLATCGGYECKTEGDAFMVAFASAVDAVRSALLIQKELHDADWPPELFDLEAGEIERDGDDVVFRGLRVRIGIHVGMVEYAAVDPISKRMDYFGTVVNKSARVESCAQGGQILLSQETLAALHQGLLSSEIDLEGDGPNAGALSSVGNALGAVVYDLGAFTLRSLGEGRLFEIVPMSLQARKFLPVVEQQATSTLKEELSLAREENANLLRSLKMLQGMHQKYRVNIDCLEAQLRAHEITSPPIKRKGPLVPLPLRSSPRTGLFGERLKRPPSNHKRALPHLDVQAASRSAEIDNFKRFSVSLRDQVERRAREGRVTVRGKSLGEKLPDHWALGEH